MYKFQRKPFIENTAKWISHSSCGFDCNEWNWLPNSGLFPEIKLFESEKLVWDLFLVLQVS